jgi:hypothetical protein
MIALVPAGHDDPAFLAIAQRIVNGAIAALQVREVYLVHVDNWFDHKWLGWWSNWKHKELKELYVPPFNPNRVCSQTRFIWDPHSSQWTPAGQGKRLHLRQPGRRALHAQRLDRFAKSAAFVWYSGNTVSNQAGSVMLYVAGAETCAWYASFRKDQEWIVADEFHVTNRELASFEELGRQME